MVPHQKIRAQKGAVIAEGSQGDFASAEGDSGGPSELQQVDWVRPLVRRNLS